MPATEPNISIPQFHPLDAEFVSSAIPTFFVGRNKDGFWVVREATGRIGAVFLLKCSALGFAKRENSSTGCATIFLPEPIELDLENRGNQFVTHLAPWVTFKTHCQQWVAAVINRIMDAVR